MHKNLKILVRTTLGVGLMAIAYGGWNIYQDQQFLRQVKAQEQAIKTYQQQTKQHPKDPQGYVKLGDANLTFWGNAGKAIRISLQQNDWKTMSWGFDLGRQKVLALKQAIAAYTTALSLDPSLGDAHTGLCTALIEQDLADQEAKTIAVCRQAIQAQPQQARPYLGLGIALSRKKQWSEAEAQFRQYLAITTDKGNGYYQLGKVQLAQAKLDGAIASFRQAVRLSPRSNLSYQGLGDAYAAQGNAKDAIAAYRKSIQVQKLYPPVYMKLGDVLIQEDRAQEAIPLYQQLIQLYPTLSEGYEGLGRVLAQQQKWDDAIAVYQQAIDLDPNNAWVLNGRGTLYAQKGDLDNAIADYSQAIRMDSNNSDFWIDRGAIYGRQGNFDKALADLHHAVQLDPNSASPHNALCWQGSLWGQATQVLSACEKAIALAPPQEQDDYRVSRGLARAMTGDFKGAIADLEASVAWQKTDVAKIYASNKTRQRTIATRQTWIQSLKNQQNPFTPQLRADLLQE